MKKEIICQNKVVITADEAERGYKLVGTSLDFAFVQPVNENVVMAIPVRKTLKAAQMRFEALDFLKFRQGVKSVGEPWNYLMVINGLSAISITHGAKSIHFEKMVEMSWNTILPELTELLEFHKYLLFNDSGRFDVVCPHCSESIYFERSDYNWTRDDATGMFSFETLCAGCGKPIEVVKEPIIETYFAVKVE